MLLFINAAAGNGNQQTKIIVDIKAGTVDGINMRQDGEKLLSLLGKKRVVKHTRTGENEMGETEVYEWYEISFGKHLIYKNPYHYSFTDPIFITKEGLRIGSTISEFEKFFGKANLNEEVTCKMLFSNGSLYIPVSNVTCSDDKNQKATEIVAW